MGHRSQACNNRAHARSFVRKLTQRVSRRSNALTHSLTHSSQYRRVLHSARTYRHRSESRNSLTHSDSLTHSFHSPVNQWNPLPFTSLQHTTPRHGAAPTVSITAMQPQTSHTCNLSRIILHAPTPSPVALCCRTAICASAHAQCQCNVRRKPASLAKLRRLPHHACCWDGAYLARRRVAAAIAVHRLVGMIAPHKCGRADRLSCVAQLTHACILLLS